MKSMQIKEISERFWTSPVNHGINITSWPIRPTVSWVAGIEMSLCPLPGAVFLCFSLCLYIAA